MFDEQRPPPPQHRRLNLCAARMVMVRSRKEPRTRGTDVKVCHGNPTRVQMTFMTRPTAIKLLTTVLRAASIMGASAASAYGCTGTLDSVSLNPSGVITVSSTASQLRVFYVCQIGATENGVDPNTCKAILASLIAAKEAGEQVQWQFNDSLSCQTHPRWTWLTGWYYGPVLQ